MVGGACVGKTCVGVRLGGMGVGGRGVRVGIAIVGTRLVARDGGRCIRGEALRRLNHQGGERLLGQVGDERTRRLGIERRRAGRRGAIARQHAGGRGSGQRQAEDHDAGDGKDYGISFHKVYSCPKCAVGTHRMGSL